MSKPKTTQEDTHCLLIAMPQLKDPNFQRTVSLMVEFNQEAAMGFILNRPTPYFLDKALPDSHPYFKKLPIFVGGPVQINTGWFIHAYPDISKDGQHIKDDLYLHGSVELLTEIIEAKKDDEVLKLRFFFGYAGWTEGQLETEISQSSWVCSDYDTDFIFQMSAMEMWAMSLKRMGIDPHQLVSPETQGQMH